MMKNHEEEIINFIDEEYNTKKYFIFGSKKSITLDMSIRDDLNLVYEDAVELMDEYFQRWSVERSGYRELDYFNPEYLGSKEDDPHKSLTLRMLVECAKAGKWLYK